MMTDWLNFLQWPATAVTLVAAWQTASSRQHTRRIGFWLFLGSNVLWIIWAVPAHAYALVALQVGLAVVNIRGAFKNERGKKSR